MDLIVSNPPYVPLSQRDGPAARGARFRAARRAVRRRDGFELYDRIVADAPRVLRPGGWLVMELGFGCADHVAALLRGWDAVTVEPDLAGIPRVIAASHRDPRRTRGREDGHKNDR